MTGWIALDVDGTITVNHHDIIPKKVAMYLKSLHLKGWKFVFLTGRSRVLAKKILSSLEFPFFFAPQNGATLFESPSQKKIFGRYLSKNALSYLEKTSEQLDCTMIVYSGVDQRCYWKALNYRTQVKSLPMIQRQIEEDLLPFAQMNDEQFSLVEFVGYFDPLAKLCARLKKDGILQSSLIQHPFDPNYYLLLVTDKDVNKGSALRELFKRKGRGGSVIAAGNDDNDLSMLQEADIKIVMADAPQHVLKEADFIAPSAQTCGIIQALKKIVE